MKFLHLLHGDEVLTKLEAADEIREQARTAGYNERDHYIVESQHFDWSQVTQASDNLSLFATLRIVEITINTAKPSADACAFFESAATNPAPDTLYLFNVPKLDRSATESAWFAACSKVGNVIAAPLVEREQLPGWIAKRLKKHGFEADRDVVEFLCERCEGNLLAAKQEIEKLSLLLPKGSLKVEDLIAAVADVARYDPNELSEAFLRGDLARYARVLEGLHAEGEQAPRLSWMISEDVHALANIFLARRQGTPLVQALRSARVWGKRQKAMEVATDAIAPQRIAELLKRCATLDAQSKGQAAGDAWLTLGSMAAFAHGKIA
jgi:DNA polymerase III subunit delta